MQTTTYEGYFNNGCFYTSGKAVRIPEQRRVIITILDELDNAQAVDSDKLAAWNEFKRMIAESAHENHLLTDDAFKRDKSSRELIAFESEVDE